MCAICYAAGAVSVVLAFFIYVLVKD